MRYPTKIILALFWIGILLSPANPLTAVTAAAELPTAARVVLSRAQELMEAGAYDQALETIDRFQARGGEPPRLGDPDPRGYHHAEVYFTIGNIFFATQDPEKAGAAYQQAIARDANHTGALLNLARILYDQEAYAQAAESFSRAYETVSQKEPEYLYYAAVCWLIDGLYEPSANAFLRLTASHPDDIRPEWRENMVHAFLSADRPGDALFHIKILAGEYEGDKRVQWQEILLYQYLRMDMKEKAEEYAMELTRESPVTDAWWKALAHVALSRGSYENALVAFTIYSYLTPLSAEEQKLLADLNLHVGIPVMAVPAYEAAMSEKPGKSILQNLIIAYQQLEKHEKALKTIAAFEGHEEDPELVMLKADILYTIKEFDAAGAAYRGAAENKSRHEGRAWLMAGYAAWQTGDISLARNAFEKAAAFDTQKADANTALKQLDYSSR